MEAGPWSGEIRRKDPAGPENPPEQAALVATWAYGLNSYSDHGEEVLGDI